MELKYIIIAAILVIILIICVFLIVSKKKKDQKANEPIHKEYDASIENIVNEEKTVENSVSEIDSTKFKNVGTIAMPIITESSNQQETIAQENVQPIQEEIPVVEQKQPEVAVSNPGQTLDNYEITLPEEQKVMDMTQNANMNPTPVKQEPVFMANIPEEEKTPVEPKRNEIIIDEPNIEEL